MINWFYQLSKSRQIGVGTLAAHLLIILFLTVHHWTSSSAVKKHRPIAVRTMSPTIQQRPNLQASVSQAKSAHKKAPTAKTAAPKRELPQQLPQPPAPPVKPITAKPAAAAKATKNSVSKSQKKMAAAPTIGVNDGKKKKVATAQQKVLLDELEQTLKEMEVTPITKKTALIIPTLGERKKEVAHSAQTSIELSFPDSSIELSPSQQISTFLQQALRLPEIGQVRMKISIAPSGKMLSLEVVDSKSEKNAQFLKKHLPELHFPCLNETVSLTIVFSNEV